jgi:hypothetical protein
MPNLNGMGPNGAGAMTGRGLGRCSVPRELGPGSGYGRGMGHGMGRGFGRRLGWFGVGYGHESEDARALSLQGALEQRATYLRAELERTEALLKDAPKQAVSEEGQAK